jgi:hypothetical protein
LQGNLSIDWLVYDPPGSDTGAETITITNDSDTSFGPKELWMLIGAAQTKRYLPDAIDGGQTVTSVWSFAFANSKATCVELWSDYGKHDERCYDPADDKDAGSTSYWPAKIVITDLIHDPEGNDTDHESITLTLEEWSSVDLSDYRLLVGTRKKTLQGTLQAGESLTITKTFGFPNTKLTCVTLLLGEKAIDVRCYDPTSSDIGPAPEATISIDDILYDPDGNDVGRETITLTLEKPDELSLEWSSTSRALSFLAPRHWPPTSAFPIPRAVSRWCMDPSATTPTAMDQLYSTIAR